MEEGLLSERSLRLTLAYRKEYPEELDEAVALNREGPKRSGRHRIRA